MALTLATMVKTIMKRRECFGLTTSTACSKMVPPSNGRIGIKLNSPIPGPAHSALNCAGVSPRMGHSIGPPSARYSAVPVTI